MTTTSTICNCTGACLNGGTCSSSHGITSFHPHPGDWWWWIGAQQGWVCPKCGRGNAPSVKQCPCSTTFTWTPSVTPSRRCGGCGQYITSGWSHTCNTV